MAPTGKTKKGGSSGPEGVNLNDHWRVGPFLGSGAQASVHALLKKKDKTGSKPGGGGGDDQYSLDPEYVVKLAELPDRPAAAKGRKSAMEINADAINGENMCYHALRALQGRLVPRLPPFAATARDARAFPPSTGTAQVDGKPKYRFLVIERMDEPLFSLVDRLVKAFAAAAKSLGAARGGGGTVSLGPIFHKMIMTVQEIHAAGRLVVDVKADNWMLLRRKEEGAAKKSTSTGTAAAAGKGRAKAGAGKSKALAPLEAEIREMAGEIRCLDLAMAHSYRSYTGSHREDRVGGPVQEGTPLYASAHVHGGHLPSRRDDLFGVGIVFAELLIRVRAAQLGTAGAYEGAKSKVPSYLPWALEASEEAMAASATSHLFDPSSELYRRMPPGGSARAMLAYFERAHAVGYDKKPPYDDLLALVGDLPVAVVAAAPPPTSAPKSKPAAAALSPARDGCRGAAKRSAAVAASTAASPAQPRPKSPPAAAAKTTAAAAKKRSNAEVAPSSAGGRPARAAKSRRGGQDGAVTAASKKGGRGSRDDEDEDDAMDVEDTSFLTARTSPSDDEEMMEADEDDEVVEVFPGAADSKKPAASPKAEVEAAPGIELKVVSGPGAGQSFRLVRGAREVLEIGYKPSASAVSSKKAGTTIVASIPDPDLAPSHAKLKLVVTSGGSRTVEVQNLGRKGGGRGSGGGGEEGSVRVNGKPVPTKMQAFCGDTIRLGASTVLQVALGDGGPDAAPAPEKENVAARRRAAR